MTDFLDQLKTRMQDAQKRLQAAQQETQAAQAKYQAVAQEYNSLQFLLNAETAKLQQKNSTPTDAVPDVPAQQAPLAQTPDFNKTNMIRELLRQHPAGMTPTEIWKQIKTQMTHRAYLYSVLKRLKDKDEVIVRRGKYMAKITPKSEEGREQTLVQ